MYPVDTDPIGFVAAVTRSLQSGEGFEAAQLTDRLIQTARMVLEGGALSPTARSQQLNKLLMEPLQPESGVLCRKPVDGGIQLVVPTFLVPEVLTSAYDDPVARH